MHIAGVFVFFYAFFVYVEQKTEKNTGIEESTLAKNMQIMKNFMDFQTGYFPKFGFSPHIKIRLSAFDSDTPDMFLEFPFYMPSFGEKDQQKQCWVLSVRYLLPPGVVCFTKLSNSADETLPFLY